WFRPVDIHIGPDGAMYILDFYNRIIGHYEVPLPHPGRDRTSGRIWRVSYKGENPKTKPAKMPEDLTKGIDTAARALGNPNLERGLQAKHYISDFLLKDWVKMRVSSTTGLVGNVNFGWLQTQRAAAAIPNKTEYANHLILDLIPKTSGVLHTWRT